MKPSDSKKANSTKAIRPISLIHVVIGPWIPILGNILCSASLMIVIPKWSMTIVIIAIFFKAAAEKNLLFIHVHPGIVYVVVMLPPDQNISLKFKAVKNIFWFCFMIFLIFEIGDRDNQYMLIVIRKQKKCLTKAYMGGILQMVVILQPY